MGRPGPLPPLAERMSSGDPVLGLIVKMPNPALVEHARYMGFDLVVIDTEHGLNDGVELEHHLRAADSVGIATLVRVGSNDAVDILRILDAGASGVIVPHVASHADAESAVSCAHYPPRGTRGLAQSTRGGHYGIESIDEYLTRKAEETVVVVQIEDRTGLQNVVEIAKTDGVTGVWVGPSDLSVSLGLPGQLEHPEVRTAVEGVVDVVAGSQDAAAVVIIKSASEILDWSRRGASVFLITAVDLMANAAREIVVANERLKDLSNHSARKGS